MFGWVLDNYFNKAFKYTLKGLINWSLKGEIWGRP